MLRYFMTSEFIAIQILTGFAGSLLAGFLIYLLSHRGFKKAIEASETNVRENLKPINQTIVNVAGEIKELAKIINLLKDVLEKK